MNAPTQICDACECVSHCSKHGCIPITADPDAPLSHPATQAGALQAVTLLAAKHTGMRVDYSGLLKQAQNGLRREPALAEMLRQLKDHMTELGRRWYAGDVAVVDEILQLYCVEQSTRESLAATQPNAAPAAEVVAWEYQNMGGRTFLTHADPAGWHPHDREGFQNFRALGYLAAPATAIDAREPSPNDELLVACIKLNGATLTVEPRQLADMFGTDDEQHTYELTFKRMTRAAFEALGEFNGF